MNGLQVGRKPKRPNNLTYRLNPLQVYRYPKEFEEQRWKPAVRDNHSLELTITFSNAILKNPLPTDSKKDIFVCYTDIQAFQVTWDSTSYATSTTLTRCTKLGCPNLKWSQVSQRILKRENIQLSAIISLVSKAFPRSLKISPNLKD